MQCVLMRMPAVPRRHLQLVQRAWQRGKDMPNEQNECLLGGRAAALAGNYCQLPEHASPLLPQKWRLSRAQQHRTAHAIFGISRFFRYSMTYKHSLVDKTEIFCNSHSPLTFWLFDRSWCLNIALDSHLPRYLPEKCTCAPKNESQSTNICFGNFIWKISSARLRTLSSGRSQPKLEQCSVKCKKVQLCELVSRKQ